MSIISKTYWTIAKTVSSPIIYFPLAKNSLSTKSLSQTRIRRSRAQLTKRHVEMTGAPRRHLSSKEDLMHLWCRPVLFHATCAAPNPYVAGTAKWSGGTDARVYGGSGCCRWEFRWFPCSAPFHCLFRHPGRFRGDRYSPGRGIRAWCSVCLLLALSICARRLSLRCTTGWMRGNTLWIKMLRGRVFE